MNGGISQQARVLDSAMRDNRLHKLAKRPDPNAFSIDLWRKTNALDGQELNHTDVGLLMIARERINAAIEEVMD